ncbi:uncharacterized protein LOC117123658 [Anneissia japonica]|uniref:uncharacterized protein LOC117123658 n=1 Tax=Anneissia japonica TaxID=1529436 RepID=UPI00142568DD|nr:uncharacterized protein LOC117123658 [Anneissia japonica]
MLSGVKHLLAPFISNYGEIILVDELEDLAISLSMTAQRDDWYELIPQQVELSSPSASKRKTTSSSPQHPTKEARTSSSCHGSQVSDFSTLEQDAITSDGGVFTPSPNFVNGVMGRTQYRDDNDNHVERNDNLKDTSLELSDSSDSVQKTDAHEFFSAVELDAQKTRVEQYPFVDDDDFVSSSEIDIPLPTSEDEYLSSSHQAIKEVGTDLQNPSALQKAIANISQDFVSGNLTASISNLPLDSSFSSLTSQGNDSTASSTNSSPRRIPKGKSKSVSSKNKDNKRKLLNGYTASSDKSSSVLNSKLEKISKSERPSIPDHNKSSHVESLSGISIEKSDGQVKFLKDTNTDSKNEFASHFLPQSEVDAKDTHKSFQSKPTAHEASADLENETISYPSEKYDVSILTNSVALIDKKPITTSTPYVQLSHKQTKKMKAKQDSEKIKSVKKTTKSPRSSLESSNSSLASEGRKSKVRSQSPKQVARALDLSNSSASSTESKKVTARSQSPKYVTKHSTCFRERSQSPKQIAKASTSKPSFRSTSVDSKHSCTVSPKRGSKKPKSKSVVSLGKSNGLSQSNKSESNLTSSSKNNSLSSEENASTSASHSLSTSEFASQNSSNQMSEDSIGPAKEHGSQESTRGSNIQLPLNLNTLKPEIEKVSEQNIQFSSKASSVTSSIKFGTDSSQSAPESESDSKTKTPDLKPVSSYIQYPSDLQSENLTKSAIQKESDLECSSNTAGQLNATDSRQQVLSRENLSLDMYTQRDSLARKVAELLAEDSSRKGLSRKDDSENSSKAGTPDSIEEDQKERAMRIQYLQENAPNQKQEKSYPGSASSSYHDALSDNAQNFLQRQTEGHRPLSPQSDTSTSSSVRAIIDRVMTKGSEVSFDPRFSQQGSPVGSVASEPSGSATSRLRQSHSRSDRSGFSAIDRSRLLSSSAGGRGSSSSLIWDSFAGPSDAVAPHVPISSTMSSQTPSMGLTQTSQEAKSDTLSLTAEWQARKSSQVQRSTSSVSVRSSDSLASRVQKLLATTAYLDGDTRKMPQESTRRARIDSQSEAEGFSLARSLSPQSANHQNLLSEHGRSMSTDDLTGAQHLGYTHAQMQYPDMKMSNVSMPNEGHSSLQFGPDISQNVGSYPSFEQGGPDGMSSMLEGGRAPSRVSSISVSPRMSPHPNAGPIMSRNRQASIGSQEDLEGLVNRVRMILGTDAPQERVERIIKAALLEEGRQSAELEQYYSAQNLSEYSLSDQLSGSPQHYGSDPHLAQHQLAGYQQYSQGASSGSHPNLRNIAAISHTRNLITNQMQRAAQNRFDHSIDIRGMPTEYDRHTPLQHRSSPQVPPLRIMDDWQRREAWLDQAEKAAQSDRLAYGMLPDRTSPLSNSRSPSRTSSSMASSPDRFFALSPQQSPKKPYTRDSDPYFDYHLQGPQARLARPRGRQFQTIAAMEMSKQYCQRENDWNDPYHYQNSSRPGSVHEVPSRHAHSFSLPQRPVSAGNYGPSAFHSVPKAHGLSRRANPRYHTVSGIDPNELIRQTSPSMANYPARMSERPAAYGTPVYEHLHPYKPPGSAEVMYTYPYGSEGVGVSSPAHTETTLESTHPGSDDAQPPHFPRHVLGERQEAHEKYPPTGIYSSSHVVSPGSHTHRLPTPDSKSLERRAKPLAWDVPKDTDKEEHSPPGQRLKKVGGVTTWKELSLSKSSSEGEDKSEEESERSGKKTQIKSPGQQQGHQFREVSGGRKSRREESPHKPSTFFVDFNGPDVMDPMRHGPQDPESDAMEAEMDRIRSNLERSRSGRPHEARPVYQSPPFSRKVGVSGNGPTLPGSYSRQVLQQVIQQENSSDNHEYAQAWDDYQRSKVKDQKELDQHQINRLANLIQNPVQYYSTRTSTSTPGSSIIGEISDDASSISSTGSIPRRRKKWRKDTKFTPKQQSPDEADRNIAEDLQHKIVEEEENDETNSSSSDETKPGHKKVDQPSNDSFKAPSSPSDNKYDDILKETTLSDLSVDSEKLYRMLGPKGVEKLSSKLTKLQQRIEIQKEHHKRRTTGKKVPLAVIGPTSSSESEVSNIMSTDSSLYASELHRVSEGHEHVGRRALRTHLDRFHRMPERSSSVESEPMYRSRAYRQKLGGDDSTDGLTSDVTSDAQAACSCQPTSKPRRSQSLHDRTSRGKAQDLRKRDESPGYDRVSDTDDHMFHKPSRPAPRARDKNLDSSGSIPAKRPMKGTSFTVDLGLQTDASIQDAARRRKDKSKDKENQREPRGKDREPGAKPKTRTSKTGEKVKKSKIYTPESPDDSRKKEKPKPSSPPKPVEKPVGWFQPFSNKMSWVQEPTKKEPDEKVPGKSEAPDPLAKVSLKEAFEMHKLNFISKSKERVKKVKLAAEERHIQEQYEKERLKIFQEEKPKQANPHAHPLSEQLHSPKRRTMSRKEMKAQTEKIYSNLPEVKKKIEVEKRSQANQTNRLRAQLYKKRLMERLKGRPWTGPSL